MRSSTSILWMACLALLVGTGCASKLHFPDLGAIYNRAAQYHGVERNPVIVIPGILGSRLKDSETGALVWGAFGRGTISASRDQGARLAALPMAQGEPLAALKDGVVADGALDRLRLALLLFPPVELKAYANILTSLGAGGYRDQGLAAAGAVDYGDEHFTCFQFAYDWRRSNAENARLLHEYILDRRAYVQRETEKRFGIKEADIKFDIVAHSMGGLITRYYLRYGAQPLPADGGMPELTWGGAKHVEKAVLVGTPSAGSTKAIRQLAEGLNLKPIASYAAAILGTHPATYELLPRPRHGHLVDIRTKEKIDLYDPKVWNALGWGLADPEQDPVLRQLLPEVSRAEERREIAQDHLVKSLRNAKQFHEALDRPAKLPRGLSLELVAGDAQDTASVLAVEATTGKLTTLETAAGDGVVLRSSALMDERAGNEWMPTLVSPIDWTKVNFLFTDHLGLTKDPIFTDNILYSLLEAPRERARIQIQGY